MPKRLAQVAAFALGNPDEIAFGTTASIAAASDVQPSTLVRLAHHLGYEGFSDLQSIFRERLRDRTLSYEERLVTLEQASGEDEDASLLSGFISAASQSINRLAATVQTDTFARAVDILAAAETIYLIAKRRSYPLTAHMTYAFSKLEYPPSDRRLAKRRRSGNGAVRDAERRGNRRKLLALCGRQPDARPKHWPIAACLSSPSPIRLSRRSLPAPPAGSRWRRRILPVSARSRPRWR